MFGAVVRELGVARDGVLAGFRARGGDRDRWGRRDRAAMVEALVAEEDRMEMAGSRKAENMAARIGVRAVRRVLEREVYPSRDEALDAGADAWTRLREGGLLSAEEMAALALWAADQAGCGTTELGAVWAGVKGRVRE